MFQQPSSKKLRISDTGKESSLNSWPRHADSPSSSSSQASFSSEDSEIHVKEAVGFMRAFLHEKSQDVSEQPKFLECVDLISTSIDSEKDGFRDEYYNATLLRDILRFLSPGIASPNTEEREQTLSRIAKIISCIINHCLNREGMKAFKLGKIAGGLILCCSDPSESVCCWAADALHRLYTLIMHQRSLTKVEDNQAYLDLLREWEEEKILWLAWFSDISMATTIFKKCLHADDEMELILTALSGMRDNHVHSTKAAVLMLKAMLREPRSNFVKVPKIVRIMYSSLEHITEPSARHEVFRLLRLVSKSHPEEVVRTLLRCSLQCDCTASAMWNALMSFSVTAQKILNVLQDTVRLQPFHRDRCGVKPIIAPLAATAALQEILRHPPPACREVLKAIYPTLSIALLCQISYTVHIKPQEIDLYWRTCVQQEIPTPPVPLRAALTTLQILIQRMSAGDQALIMNKRRGSELLCHLATHQKGLSVFAKALIRNEGCENMLPYIMKILDSKEDQVHIIVLTFLVELLQQKTFDAATEEDLIQYLHMQLNASQFELRYLALEGLLCLSAHPEKVVKLVPALPDILGRLKDANRKINVKALQLLPCVLKGLTNEEVNLVTLDVATKVLPLFDDASNKVRLAAISTFCDLFDIIRRRAKDLMKEVAIQSMVPLMVHLQDESILVTQACWLTLRRIDKFLKSFLQFSISENDLWSFCTSLLKRYLEQGESIFMEQAFAFLDSPRQPLQEGAVKLLEIIARETSHKSTVSAIATVLNLVTVETKPSNICLEASGIVENAAHESPSETFLERWFDRITMICRR